MENLIEERGEFMVTGKGHSLEKAHFIKPYATSVVPKLPRLVESVSSSMELKDLSSRISFSGFWSAGSDYITWLEEMEDLHGQTWRQAGIYEAIKASTYHITEDKSLIFSLTEKWCSETNTFIFPWGEATITLEDVMVLFGFSILGSPVGALESSEMNDSVEKQLDEVAKDLGKHESGRARQSVWKSSFKGHQLEHEAFLVLWLSFFVFPSRTSRCISRPTISIAIRLARSERIALAPAVLACVYRNLGELHGLIRQKHEGNKVCVTSLLRLVQIWTWERFKNVGPEAREIPGGEPRIARWKQFQKGFENVSFDNFEWRPYTKALRNWNTLMLYVDEAMWVTIDDGIDEKCVSFARCVRGSQLVGEGSVQDYNPHRVARQFGLAQDIPGVITHQTNLTEKEAWDNYNKPLNGLNIYMPCRLARGCVTTRYQDWWLKSVSRSNEDEETAREQQNKRQRLDDDEVDASVIHAEEKTMVDEGIQEANNVHHEDEND